MDEVIVKESWNIKKILIAVFLVTTLVVGGYFFKTKDSENELVSPSGKGTSVKGTSSVGEASGGNSEDNKNSEDEGNKGFNIREAIRERINNLQKEVSDLNLIEVASSSPQIQKIIKDIKALEEYPVNQARDMCKKICESF